ncbi:MAG: ROK family protein [Acidimicrobiales bacterium]
MLTAGVDVGGTKILGVAVDARRAEVVGEPVRLPTPKGSAVLLLDAIEQAVREVESALSPSVAGVDAVGVGLPGLVDRSGTLRMGPHVPGIVNEPFAEPLVRRLGRPVTVDNDATCAVWAESSIGAARGASDVVMVTLGTGIGTGIVAGGRLQRGGHGFAGEAGHMVVDPDGHECACGRRGCWEQYASGNGLSRLARGRRAEEVVAAARAGERDAVEALRRFAWWFALGLANLVALLDPQVVVVGGGVIEAGDVLFDPLRSAYRELVMAGDVRPEVAIVPAALGERANAIGAALLASR